jgi:hypothetical protein
MAGHLSSLARASATGDGEIFSAKMRGAELWGTRAVPLDSLVEIKRLYFGLASVALGNGAAAQFDGQGRVIRKGINRGGKLCHATQGLYDQFGCDSALSRKDPWLDSKRG